jgi:septal ring factor EnvC (AmiA/AmiB activator)
MAKKSDFSPDALRARFHDLTAEKAALEKEIAPLQKRRDGLAAKMATIEEDIRPVNEQLKEARAPLYQIDNELAMLTRALGGQTGDTKAA